MKKIYEDKYTFSSITELGKHRKSTFQKNLFDRFLPRLNDDATVLEVGSGRGEFAEECKRRGYEYVGIEPSAILAELLTDRGFKIINEKVPPLQILDRSFDLIHSMDVLEHLSSYNEALELFTDCFQILKKRGFLCVIAPNYSTLKELFYEYEYQHSFPTTEPRIKQLLKDSGYHVIRHKKVLLSFSWEYIDRILAHILIPISRSTIFRCIARIGGENLLFRIHKNLFDHIAVLGQKP